MTDKPYSLNVKMAEVTLDPILLDNLASEYYGEIVVPAGPGDDDEISVEFKGESGLSMLKQFIKALDCFRVSTA